MMLAGWGRYPRRECRVTRPRDEPELRRLMGQGELIARGNGRAYGDSALSEHNTVDMRGFNRMLAFDPETGQLVVEAGVLLADVIQTFLPRGWFPAVTPGTRLVTIGGMIAADVHGKNHHRDGSIGAFVDWIDVMGADGVVRRCSPTEDADLFRWTLGGMGLTGVVLRAAIRLRGVETGWLRQKTIAAPNLASAMEAFEAANDTTYTAAWIDCLSSGKALGRSVLQLGEHAQLDELPERCRRDRYALRPKLKLTVPLDAPSFTLNRLSVTAFNAAVFTKGRLTAGDSLVDWDSHFYPLDSILNWNRIYGRRGFAQFQCALPLESSAAGLNALLGAISRAGCGSFLAVLKRLGAQSGAFSFPMKGYTLALDFPVSRASLALMGELDRITIDHGGRFYLAKDSRMTAEVLRQADPRVERFREMRAEASRATTFVSVQSQRLGI